MCEAKHGRVSVCTRACGYVTRLHLGQRGWLWLFFFPPESERTRAKGVVAKEAWGDYKDLGL